MGHGVGDDGGEVDGKIERPTQQRVVLELTHGQTTTHGGDVGIDGVVGDDALAIVANRVDDDPKAEVGRRGALATAIRGCCRRSRPTRREVIRPGPGRRSG